MPVKTLTRDAVKVFFKAIVGLTFKEFGAAAMLLFGLILMASESSELGAEAFKVEVAVKTVGFLLFLLGVLILRRIDPDNWVNPRERKS